MLPRVLFFGALIACGATSSKPLGLTLSNVPSSEPLAPARTNLEDPEIALVIDRACTEIKEARYGNAAVALMTMLCPGHAVPRLPADIEDCPRSASAGHSTGWVMLGELAFHGVLEPGAGPPMEALAETSYRRATEGPEPSRYDLLAIQYKIGLAQRQQRHYPEAFATLLEILEKAPSGELSAGALESAAAVLAEPDWDDDGQEDPLVAFDRPEVRALVREGAGYLPDLCMEVARVALASDRCSVARRALGELAAVSPFDPRIKELNERIGTRCP